MFRGAQGGYTIAELMIVLTISLAILVSATLVFRGTTNKNQFTQGMRDINSKLISWIHDVSNGFPGDINTNYACTLDASDRPQINSGTGSTNPSCIFIGKVIQFTTNTGCANCDPDSLYAYSIFGRRVNSSTGLLTTNISDANPVPAVGGANVAAASGNADLTEKYSLPWGTTIKSTLTSPLAYLSNDGGATISTAQTNLLGISQSFNATASGTLVSGSQSLYVYSSMVGNNAPGNGVHGPNVTNCIELKSGACKLSVSQDPNYWPPAVKTWQACFVSAFDPNQTALITVYGNLGLSAQTKLEFKPC